MNLTIQEIKKILKRRSVLIVLAVFIVINVSYIIVDASVNNDEATIGYWKVHERIQGKMTDETISFVMGNYERLSAIIASGDFEKEKPSDEFYTGYAFGDMYVFEEHRKEMERIFLFNDTIETLKASAKDNIAFYRSIGNSYEVRKSELISKTYGSRILDNYYDMSGMKKYLSYDFSSLLIILMLIFTIIPIFTNERESGMDKLILTSVRGRHKTALAKKHAAMVITLIISVLFYISDIICFLFAGHLYGWSVPIYQIKQFDFSPLTITVWQFMLLSFFIKCMGCLIIGQITLFISSLFKETITAFAVGAAVLILCVGLYGHVSADVVNPVSFLVSRDLLSTISYLNVFGMPVSQFILMIIFGIVELFAVYGIIHLTYGSNFLIANPLTTKIRKVTV